MKLKLAASLLGLALFTTPHVAMAQDATAPAAATVNLPQEFAQLLADKRKLQELSPEELKARFKLLRQLLGDQNLTPELHAQVKQMAEATKAELEARAQGDQKKAADTQGQTDTKAAADAKAAKDQAAIDAKAASDAKAAADTQAAADAKAAKDQAAKAQAAIDAKAASDAKAAADAQSAIDAKAAADVKAAADAKAAKDQVAKAQAAADAEAAAAAKAAKDKAAKEQAALAAAAAAAAAAAPAVVPTPPAIAAAPAITPTPPAVAAAPAVVPTPPAVAPAPQVAAVAPLAPAPKPLEKPTTAVPAAAPAVAQAPDPAKVKALDSNPVDPAAELKAKAYLADATDITKLSDDLLRKRLDDVRELLVANDLSQETERAVRAKLLKERDVLRLRVAQAEAAKQQQAAAQAPPPAALPPAAPSAAGKVAAVAPPPAAPAQKAGGGLNFNLSIGIITGLTPPRQILEDRRPPEQLQVQELQRRIQVYGQAQGDQQYDPAYRDYWRQSLAYDREMLRQRMKEERRRRADALTMAAAQNQIDVTIDPYATAPRQRLPRSVFAAEVSDMDMQDVLTAPPPRFDRRFKLNDIANMPDIRNALPRVEVDTVHFGYNEGFIREEELGNLDGVATTIERIVKKYPNEVFLIEGHTDAVGSDAYNLKLSKLRAESVKRALSTYYIIPAKNLRTVGLGERFLKIPTSDPEPENRRVSILRITPLLGQGQ